MNLHNTRPLIPMKSNEEKCDIHVVGNYVFCLKCGDTGIGTPTLQEPDGSNCKECSSN